LVEKAIKLEGWKKACAVFGEIQTSRFGHLGTQFATVLKNGPDL